MNKRMMLVVVTITCFLNVVNASELNGSIKSAQYVSKEGTIKCDLPVLDEAEEISDNWVPFNESVNFLYEGGAMFSVTKKSTATHSKYIVDSMDLKAQLLAIDKYWQEEHYDLFVLSNTEQKFIDIEQKTYRLIVTAANLNHQHYGYFAQLYTIDDENIIMYFLHGSERLGNKELKEKLFSFHGKCTY